MDETVSQGRPHTYGLDLPGRLVARTVLRRAGEEIEVATALMVNDLTEVSVPVLWQTVISGGPQDGWQARYESREAALVGHRKIVAAYASAKRERDELARWFYRSRQMTYQIGLGWLERAVCRIPPPETLHSPRRFKRQTFRRA